MRACVRGCLLGLSGCLPGVSVACCIQPASFDCDGGVRACAWFVCGCVLVSVSWLRGGTTCLPACQSDTSWAYLCAEAGREHTLLCVLRLAFVLEVLI